MNTLSKLLAATVAGFFITSQSASAEINIGIAAEAYPPFAEKAADGTWKGWEIEMIGALCDAMKEECKLVPVAWDGIIPALLAKKMDIIMASMSITAERQRTIMFSDKYYNTPAVIVAPKGSSIDGTPASVDGKIIGVQVSTTHANYAEKHFAGSGTVKPYNIFDEHNQDLVSGRIDAVIADSIALEPFLQSDGGACCEVKAELNDEAVFGPGVGGGMRKGDTELAAKLNAAIKQIRADGTYDKIAKKYFNFNIYGG